MALATKKGSRVQAKAVDITPDAERLLHINDVNEYTVTLKDDLVFTRHKTGYYFICLNPTSKLKKKEIASFAYGVINPPKGHEPRILPLTRLCTIWIKDGSKYEFRYPFSCFLCETNKNIVANTNLLFKGTRRGWLVLVRDPRQPGPENPLAPDDGEDSAED